ncbi:mucoidy inhibitor MuiA family protein [Vitiosangium sp. GDMCC 1.1324]|uniref:mucoidy inhibitor MuiA family protein n=1 Tax=Vitiosangium sp. (strain GDMCC 1.1324) TaxID=2138576 RepID=UPI000D3649EE|nr:mucoidy inhibitor MuiA family protein [Vitiosangium sp. GDMCC 1.1324]PTL81294.1 aspartate ammonia-lyase [Vitiosangium sp. GDMCC 1.1324]
MHTLPLMMLALVAPAKVSSVVVYPDRALVTRVETVTCSGRALAVFESVPPAADPSSFRARSEDATVESLVAEEHPLKGSFGSELEALRGKREALEREMAELVDARARGQALQQLGASLTDVAVKRVTRELTEPKPDTRAWSQAFDTALDARLRAASELSARVARMREVQRELDSLRAKESFLAGSAERLERRVEVRLACPSEGRARVELKYVVGGAGWTPAYEARADEAGGQVELSTFATVRQSTGEDWSGVRLALSTARPRANATPPEQKPLLLNAREQRAERKVLVRRDERYQHAEAGELRPGATEGALLAASQGLSVQLLVPELAQVSGDGTAVRLRVARTKLKSSFAWRTVPKLHPVVFRVASLVNGAPFPLLQGPVDVFRASGFIGRQELEHVPQGGAFQLTFGIEESLRVERVVVQEIARDEGLFGGRRRFHYAYRFNLANYRKGPEVVEVAEHIPVSELDDVKVELDREKTTGGYTLEAMEGITTWKLTLAPAEQRSVDLVFHVDVPSSYDMTRL